MQPINDPRYPPVHIGVISHDLARFSAFSQSLLRLIIPTNSTWTWIQGNGFAQNRNLVVGQMLSTPAQYVWFIDDDHTFPPDIVLRLIEGDRDIIQPLISTRKPPYFPYIYDWKPTGCVTSFGSPPLEANEPVYHHYEYVTRDWDELPTGGVTDCDAVGTGGTLIRREVFEKVGKPWFEEGKTHTDSLGEDLWFCKKAKDKGFSVGVHCGLPIGHISIHEIWPVVHRDDGKDKWVLDLDLYHGVRSRVNSDIGRNAPSISLP